MNENDLLTMMSTPSDRLIADMKLIDDDILILGCGGKIGPSLAIMAKRAMDAAGLDKRVVGASVFDQTETVEKMRAAGVEVIESDLSNPAQLSALPEIKNVIYMVGRKFGTYQDPSMTWAINVLLPAKIAERYPDSNMVVFSTGNVYRYMELDSGGSCEDDQLAPVGEYGQTAMGRERVFEHFATRNAMKVLLFRLNYAIDLRYGVLFDLAKDIMDRKPINLDVGFFNCIWQGDVCEYAIRSLLHCKNPPEILNITGPETISIQWAARKMGELLGQEPVYSENNQAEKAIFSNVNKMTALMGYPKMSLFPMMEMVAEWVKSGGKTIDAPTHFETTNGKY